MAPITIAAESIEHIRGIPGGIATGKRKGKGATELRIDCCGGTAWSGV